MKSASDAITAAEGPTSRLPPTLPHERPAVPVQIRIQCAHLSGISLTLLTAIAVLMALCANGGIILETFDSTEKDSALQSTLVSQYNSYSGYLVSALIQPIDLFFPMVIAVAFLCFRTELSLD